MTHINSLDNTQLEQLYVLGEELAEAGQAIGKILRHGYESGWNGSNNRVDLERELGHVKYAINKLASSGDVNAVNIALSEGQKMSSIKPFLHYPSEGEF